MRVETIDGSAAVNKKNTVASSSTDASKTTTNNTSSYDNSNNAVYQLPTYSYTTVSAPTVSGYNASSDAAYQAALAALQSAYANTPTYTASYDAQIQDIYNQIINRDKFSYDLSSDSLFQSYKENYVNQGKLAMMDTMGQAAGLTGGYGSSYSQAVGQQQYNAYLQSLNELVPEFYDRAYQKYQDEGTELYNQYSMTKDLADTEYNKYRDQVSDYWQNVSYLADQENNAYTRGYNNYWDTTNANLSNYWNAAELNASNYWNAAELNSSNYWNYVSANKSSSSGSSGSSSSAYLSTVESQVKGMTSNDAKVEYLEQQVDNGIISEEEAATLYSIYVNSGYSNDLANRQTVATVSAKNSSTTKAKSAFESKYGRSAYKTTR